MKKYQPYSVPAMADPAPLEKRLRHILFGRGGYTMRHAVIPLVLGVVALGALLPLRLKPASLTVIADATELPAHASAAAVATDTVKQAAPVEPAAVLENAADSTNVTVRPGKVLSEPVAIHASRLQSSRYLATALPGQTLAVLSELDGFYGVLMVNNAIGWVPKDALELLDYSTEVTMPADTTSRVKVVEVENPEIASLKNREAVLETELARTRAALAERTQSQR